MGALPFLRDLLLLLKYRMLLLAVTLCASLPASSQTNSQYGSKTGQLVIFTDTDVMMQVQQGFPKSPVLPTFSRVLKGQANRIDVPIGLQHVKFSHPLFNWTYEWKREVAFLSTDTIQLSLLPTIRSQVMPLDSLYYWIESNDRTRFITALQQKSEYINQPDNAKNQIIHYAAWFNRKELVRILIDWKVNPDTQNLNGKAPLHLATIVNLLTILVDSKANYQLKDKNGNTPVQLALQYKNNLAISLWQRVDVEWSNADEFGRCGLHYPCDTAQLSKRLKTAKAAINLPDQQGFTPLFYAQSQPVVAMLLAAGADPLIQTPNGRTVLHFTNNIELVRLHEKGIRKDWNPVDKQGQTPLHTIANSDVLHFWVKKGLNVNQADGAFKTPLIYAILRGDSAYAVAKRGIERHKPHILQQMTNGQQLNMLSDQAAIQSVSQLTDDGASLNFSHSNGLAPLFYARHDPFLIQRLLAVGANANITNQLGNTPLFYIRTKEGCEALLAGGAAIKHQNKAGQTAIEFMRTESNFEEKDNILSILENAQRAKQ
jgi:ankyrin repeat protein